MVAEADLDSEVVPVKGPKKRKSKKKKAPSSCWVQQTSTDLTDEDEDDEIYMKNLFRSLETIPLFTSSERFLDVWVFIGKIISKPIPSYECTDLVCSMKVKDVQGATMMCTVNFSVKQRYISQSSLKIGATIFVPLAMKGMRNGELTVWTGILPDCIRVFPIHVEDVRKIRISFIYELSKCVVCSSSPVVPLKCVDCKRVVYCSEKCQQDDRIWHSRMCGGKSFLPS